MPEPIGRCPRGAPASGSRWGCGRLLPQGTRQPRPGLTRPSPEPGSLSVAGGFLYFNRCLQSLLGPRQGLPVFPGSTSPAAPGGVSLTVLSFLPTDDPAGSLAADGLGLHHVLGALSLGQLHRPGRGRVGRGSAGLHRCHKSVSGRLGGHRLPGHRPPQHLLPADGLLGHAALRRGHGHPQPAAQAPVLLLRLPHVPGARR
nr:type-1 angiotensin II receptor-associated protein isoform X2 [Vulpes vulpes]